MEVFPIFLGIPSLLFSQTLQLIRAFNRKKNVPNAFLKKNPVFPILAKNCPKFTIWLDVCNSLFKGWISLKNLKVGVLEPILSKFHSYFPLIPLNPIIRLSRICSCLTSLINLVWISNHHFDTFYSRKMIFGIRENKTGPRSQNLS